MEKILSALLDRPQSRRRLFPSILVHRALFIPFDSELLRKQIDEEQRQTRNLHSRSAGRVRVRKSAPAGSSKPALGIGFGELSTPQSSRREVHRPLTRLASRSKAALSPAKRPSFQNHLQIVTLQAPAVAGGLKRVRSVAAIRESGRKSGDRHSLLSGANCYVKAPFTRRKVDDQRSRDPSPESFLFHNESIREKCLEANLTIE